MRDCEPFSSSPRLTGAGSTARPGRPKLPPPAGHRADSRKTSHRVVCLNHICFRDTTIFLPHGLWRHIRQESRLSHLPLDSTLAARFSDQRISCGHRDRVACISLLRSDTRDAPQHVLVYQVVPHGFSSYSSGVIEIFSQLRLSASCVAKRRACVACVVSALSFGSWGPWVRVESVHQCGTCRSMYLPVVTRAAVVAACAVIHGSLCLPLGGSQTAW